MHAGKRNELTENDPHPSSPPPFPLPDFNLFHMIAVGLSSSILGCLVTLLVYSYCQRYQQQSHDATVIHPISAAPLNTSITNHINKLDKYDSVEAIKVCGQVNTEFSAGHALQISPYCLT